MSEDKKHSSFAVVIEPEFDENNTWTGQVVAFLEEEIENDLSEDELLKLRSVTGMMASCLQIMEEEPEFLEYVQQYLLNNNEQFVKEMMDKMQEIDAPTFTRSEDGKVITLQFNSKTYGNA